MLLSPSNTGGIGLLRLPVELLLQVMKSVPDLSSLMNLICAFPNATAVFKSYHREIFSAVATEDMSSQLRRIVHTVMTVQHHSPPTTAELDEFLCHHLDDEVQAPEINFLPDPASTLRGIGHLANVIDSLVKSFVGARLEKLGGAGIPHAQPSPAELHRIRRAFCRLQLYCDLFHHDLYDPYLRSPPRVLCSQVLRALKGPSTFFFRLCPWEIEELECVYNHLQNKADSSPGKRGTEKGCALLEIPLLHAKSLAGQLCQPGLYFRTALNRIRESYEHQINYRCIQKTAKSWRDSHGTNVANAGSNFLAEVRWYDEPGTGLDAEPDEWFHDWGYCMWDKMRLQEWGLLGSRRSWVIIQRWIYSKQRHSAKNQVPPLAITGSDAISSQGCRL